MRPITMVPRVAEKFYRDYDLLPQLRPRDEGRLLLSQSQKQNLPSYAMRYFRGVAFFFNKPKFTLEEECR